MPKQQRMMRVEQRNADLLAASRGKPVLVLANHPCYLDILVLIALGVFK